MREFRSSKYCMDYSILIDQTLTNLGIKFQPEYSAYNTQRSDRTGWSLKLPDLLPDHYLLLHFQDYVTWQNNAVVELQTIEQRYGAQANRVIVTHWNHNLSKHYSGPVTLIEFSSHNYGTAMSLQKIQPVWDGILQSTRSGWQCLNGRYDQHRRRAVDILKSWPNGTLSYGTQLNLDQASYANYFECNNEQNFIRLMPVYGRHAINIVTETIYRDPGIMTEKTMMAMAAEQIPIVIGHQGIVQDCRDLGFDMFDDLVDTSYDTLPNDSRVEQALLRNQHLITGNIDLLPYRARLCAQREFLLNRFSEQIAQRFVTQCTALAKKLGAF
jgi:hypothetical protein